MHWTPNLEDYVFFSHDCGVFCGQDESFIFLLVLNAVYYVGPIVNTTIDRVRRDAHRRTVDRMLRENWGRLCKDQ